MWNLNWYSVHSFLYCLLARWIWLQAVLFSNCIQKHRINRIVPCYLSSEPLLILKVMLSLPNYSRKLWLLPIFCVVIFRKIYDPRRWHKRTNSGSEIGGQPPAGWVLIWAGRFKRWRRRWFVANPPGLLLHYKNSNQIGRHGCISLLVREALSLESY